MAHYEAILDEMFNIDPRDEHFLNKLNIWDMPTPEQLKTKKPVFVGSIFGTPQEEWSVAIYCQMLPATTWEFNIETEEGSKYTMSTGSGFLYQYLPSAKLIARNMILVKQVEDFGI